MLSILAESYSLCTIFETSISRIMSDSFSSPFLSLDVLVMTAWNRASLSREKILLSKNPNKRDPVKLSVSPIETGVTRNNA